MTAGKGRSVLRAKTAEDGMTILERTRKLRGFSVSDLERATGVSRNAIWRYEQPDKYTRCPRPKTAKKIADALGVSVGELFDVVSTEAKDEPKV